MINDYLNAVQRKYPKALDHMVGYSEDESAKIGRLYGIKIAGDFGSFLLRAGKSDGGVVGDDPFIIYREGWTARTHVLFQADFFNRMQNVGAWDYLDKPFVFSLEAETQYFFLQTGSEQETVFHYDENRKVVRSSNMCFSEYLAHIVERYPSGRGICRGDLLNI